MINDETISKKKKKTNETQRRLVGSFAWALKHDKI